MEYRAIASLSRRLGEDVNGEAVWETHDFHCFADPLTKAKAFTLDGTEYTGSYFVAIPQAVTVAPGDVCEVDGDTYTVLEVKPVKHPKTRLIVHTELTCG